VVKDNCKGKMRRMRSWRLANDVKNVRSATAGNQMTEPKENENLSSCLKDVSVLLPKMTKAELELSISR